jgi:hypothetical protein
MSSQLSLEYLRSFRIAKIAMFDLVLTFVAAAILNALFFGIVSKRGLILYYASIIPFGIFVHLIFKQKTALNNQLFSNELNTHKLFVLGLMYVIYRTF